MDLTLAQSLRKWTYYEISTQKTQCFLRTRTKPQQLTKPINNTDLGLKRQDLCIFKVSENL